MSRAITPLLSRVICPAILVSAALAGRALALETELAAINTANQQADSVSGAPHVSPDGRFIVFTSSALNLGAGETIATDVWVRDRLLRTTAKISVPDPAMPQVLANFGSSLAHGGARVMSDDGRYVVFSSYASNLVSGDTNDVEDVFVRDRDFDGNGVFDEVGAGKTKTVRVSLTSIEGQSGGGCPNGTCTHYANQGTISADGRYIAFASPFDFAGSEDYQNIFRRDRDADNDGIFDEAGGSPNAAITELVTPSISCVGCNQDGFSDTPAISGDGRHVAFRSASSRIVYSDFNQAIDIFVRDMDSGETARMSERLDGTEGEPNTDSAWPSISFDGRYVAFSSINDDLVPDDNQNLVDIFVRDRNTDNDSVFDEAATQSLERASLGYHSFPFPGGVAPLNNHSSTPSISDDGRYVSFQSLATNNSCGLLNCSDENGFLDVFIHDRQSDNTHLVSVRNDGLQGDDDSQNSAVSADGRFVAFTTNAENFVLSDVNGDSPDAYVRAIRSDQPNTVCGGIETVSAGSYFGDTYAAGVEGSTSCTSGTGPDVWFSYTAGCTGQVTFNTIGSSYDTVLSVHSACVGTAANALACNDDIDTSAGNYDSRITLFVQQGQTYVIRVSGYGGQSGFYSLNIGECSPCCPGNADKIIPGVVNFADITSLLQNFNNVYAAGSGLGDANCDGTVNFADVTTVLQNFNDACN